MMQLVLAALFTVLFFVWLILPLPGQVYLKLLGMLGSALGVTSMVLSYRAEEKNKK
jgi:hypothetical protein